MRLMRLCDAEATATIFMMVASSATVRAGLVLVLQHLPRTLVMQEAGAALDAEATAATIEADANEGAEGDADA